MTEPTTGLTRRQVLQVGGATFAGYALAADTVLAQVIKTDTDGLTAGDAQVKIGSYSMPVYEARPASGSNHPIILVISEIWGVHEWIKDCIALFDKALKA
jgi:carboxymethylenebutenolidase